MTTPAHDVAAFLAANFVDLVVGTNLRVGKQEFPVVVGRNALSVSVENTPGIAAQSFIDGGNRSAVENPGITVRVRGDKDDYPTGEALAQRINDFLDMNPHMPGGYFECRQLGSGVAALGPDADGFPRWNVSFLLRRCAEYLPLFFGAALPGVYDAAFIQALSGMFKATRANHVFTTNALALQLIFWAQPNDYDQPVFYNGAVGLTVMPFVTVASGIAIVADSKIRTYDLRASASAGLGLVTVKVL